MVDRHRSYFLTREVAETTCEAAITSVSGIKCSHEMDLFRPKLSMATRFFFEPAHFALPSLSELKARWRFIPDLPIRDMIAAEHQYLHFQEEFLLRHLKYETPRGWVGQFGLSARAGAVKAAVLLYGSIIEAALQSHAHARGYAKPGKRLMFGEVLKAWEKAGAGARELAEIWDDIQLIKDRRNTIHLAKAAADSDAHHWAVLQREEELLSAGRKVLTCLQRLNSSAVNAAPGVPPSPVPSVITPVATPLAPPSTTPQSAPEVRDEPAVLEAWLNDNVDIAAPATFREMLLRWIAVAPTLDPAEWDRLHPAVARARNQIEVEAQEREGEERSQAYMVMYESPSYTQDQGDDDGSDWDAAETDALFYGGGNAPEESDEDNPNWYDLPEPDDEYYDDGDDDD
ncbi:MAG TPA: hypothetical protein VFJ16_13040 [Longimicrobium sp.]|nr:hypothetical protein [Longimicrobium sp.]